MNEDWFDKLTDGAPLLCSTIQLSIIDGLLRVSPISDNDKNNIYKEVSEYSEVEANKLITKLKENAIETDTREQWKRIFRDRDF
jgi:inorganic pyrophosphatase/exopolyphosphatase